MTTIGCRFLTSVLALALCAAAKATDITLQNDNIAESGTASVSVQGGLVPGEIAVAVLSTTAGNYPITLKTLKVFVGKQSMSAPNSMTVQLYVWNQGAPTAGATTPNPGTALYTSPQLSFTAGAFNTWDVSASNIVLSGACLVGCKVVSSGHIGTPPFDTYQPNNTSDKNGCQAGKNWIWAKSGANFSWASLCGFGATGDWVIHADASISQALGQFTDLGASLAGSFAPAMSGSGSLADGGAFNIAINGLPPSQVGYLFVGFNPLFADFKGGSLGPAPDLLLTLPTGAGSINLPGGMPVGAPGNFSFYMQMWTPDAGAPQGADATNTLQATTPP